MKESDGFDDDPDHWGTTDAAVQEDDELDRPGYDCAWWFFSRLLLILVVVLFVVWSGVFTYG